MKILQRYITVNLVATTLLALSGLVSLFSFFSLIDELADTGRGNYTVSEALIYVCLTMPKLAYELFPIAAVIGGMVTLGMLARNSELVVIRTAGVSRYELALLLAKASVILIIAAVVIGEFIAPISEETAQQRRSVDMTNQISMQSRNGYWARDGNSFINIRKVLPGDHVKDVYIYEFDRDNNLRSSIHADDASYKNKRWLLNNIEQTSISDKKISIRKYKHAEWPSLLDADMISYVMVKPQFMSFYGLMKYISYLRKNDQDTAPYEQALWAKIIKPFSICAMVLLAILMVRSESRFTQVGQRIFLGSLVGVLFYICDQTSGHMGIVYNISPVVSVTAPTIILLSVILVLLRE